MLCGESRPLSMSNKVESLPSMVNKIWSLDSNMQLDATTQFRKLLSKGRNPPIEEVIQSGFEAAWALTNIASGTSENTKVVIDHGTVPIFVQLMGSSSDNVREQAVWALGNIAGDSPRCRDHVLSDGALMPLLAQLNEHSKLPMLRNDVWTLSNFCRGKPQPPSELAQQDRADNSVNIVIYCRYELGTQPANTKFSSNKTIRRVRVRGGNVKWRTLRVSCSEFIIVHILLL
ncbi:hypothetical protein AgCh_000726 [Apium graveolens]